MNDVQISKAARIFASRRSAPSWVLICLKSPRPMCTHSTLQKIGLQFVYEWVSNLEFRLTRRVYIYKVLYSNGKSPNMVFVINFTGCVAQVLEYRKSWHAYDFFIS